MAFTAGQKVRASQLNILNLLASAQQAYITTSESTTSLTYVDLTTPGPSVTVTSLGTVALVWIQAIGRNTTASDSALACVAVSGATTLSAATNEANGASWQSGALSTSGNTPNGVLHVLTINPGTNTYKMQYRSSVSATTSAYINRKIIVLAP